MDVTTTPRSLGSPLPLGSPSHDPDVFSRQILSALLALRDGEFGVRLPSDFVGLNGKIADVFNDIAATSERRAQETARVSRAVGGRQAWR